MSALAWALALVSVFGLMGWVSWWMVDSAYRGALTRIEELKQDKANLRLQISEQRKEITDLKRVNALNLRRAAKDAS